MSNGKVFRRIALGMDGAIESAHMGHPDFRVSNRIFATLRNNDTLGMVVLTPDQQQTFIHERTGAFEPEAGAWGRAGCTRVRLDLVDEDTLGEALTLAWRNAASKPPVRSSKASRAKKPTSSDLRMPRLRRLARVASKKDQA